MGKLKELMQVNLKEAKRLAPQKPVPATEPMARLRMELAETMRKLGYSEKDITLAVSAAANVLELGAKKRV